MTHPWAGLGYVDPEQIDFGSGRLGVQATIRDLDAAVNSLMRDIQARTGAIADLEGGTEFIRDYAAFQGEWRVWKAASEGNMAAWVGSWFGGIQDSLRRWIARYNAYEERYQALTGQRPSRPGLTERPTVDPKRR